MAKLNRTDVSIMLALDNLKADSVAYGLTITELMEYLAEQGIPKSRMTVYRRLKGLVSLEYINKGFSDNHADTFYITEKGKALIHKRKEK